MSPVKRRVRYYFGLEFSICSNCFFLLLLVAISSTLVANAFYSRNNII